MAWGPSPPKLMDFSLFKTHLKGSTGTDFLAFCYTLKSVGRILLRVGKGWSILQNIQQIGANLGLDIRLQITSQVDYNVYLKNITSFLKKRKFSDFVTKKKGFLFLKGKVASLIVSQDFSAAQPNKQYREACVAFLAWT